MEQKSNRSSAKLLLGIGATLLANLILVTVNFTVKENPIYGGELCLIKGGVQLVVFGLAMVTQSNQELPKELSLKLHVLGFGLTVGILTLASYVAVQMVPVSDFLVICFTSPIFTVFLSKCILKTSVTFTKVGLCLILTIGVILVVKPHMIFQTFDNDSEALEMEANHTRRATEEMETGDTVNSDALTYTLGILASGVASICGALVNVQVAKCRMCSSNLLMISGGVGTLLVSFLCPLINIPNRIFEDSSGIPFSSWMLIISVSIGSIVAGLLLVIANKLASPTIVIMFRSTELIFALAGEWMIFKITPELLGCLGSILVLASVIAMPWADSIQTYFNRCFMCETSDQPEIVEDMILKEAGIGLLPKQEGWSGDNK
ncbi:hypothetical protein TCAL_14962 [Tigriopus californicus]|uniref:EamA domain-containing protein n=1 Tax=Tigriopus californicus TaxID=6832 RepID=A0A553N793_TIGCA|nr:uncharacterized protein LOC131885955 [Tigriopus californicus]TRY61304.1 hypothetical protein TCAL_14962 [Tigriopus californicus]